MRIHWLFAWFILSTGCSVQPAQKIGSAPSPTSSETHLKTAEEALERWRQNRQKQDLHLAATHYAALYARHPDNALIQRPYYQTLFWLTATRAQSSEMLDDLFGKLAPIVKQDLSPPAAVPYLWALEANAKPDQLIPLLKAAIRQQPFSAYLWGELADAYLRNREHWLALAAAERAHKIAPDDADYLFLLGYCFGKVANENSCPYAEAPYSKRAAALFGKAAGKEKSARNFSASASSYMDLGLVPLAYNQAKAAYAIEPTAAASFYYAQSAEHLKKYDEAKLAAQKLLDQHQDASAYEMLSRYAAQQKNWDLATNQLEQYKQQTSADALAELRWRWIAELSGKSTGELTQREIPNPWYNEIFQFLTSSATDKQASLDSAAADVCEKLEADFYTAYFYWRQKDTVKAKQYLTRAAASPAIGFPEHLWAKVLLEGI